MPSATHPARRLRGVGASALLAVATLLAACSPSVEFVRDVEAPPEPAALAPQTRALGGILEVRGAYPGQPGAACSGRGDLVDFRAGKSVEVTDGEGESLALGWLQVGELVAVEAASAPVCHLPWTVPGVPADGGAYHVTLAARLSAGPWTASELDARSWTVFITVGETVAAADIAAEAEPEPPSEPEATDEPPDPAPVASPTSPPSPSGSNGSSTASPAPAPSPTPAPPPPPSPPPPAPPPPPPSPTPTRTITSGGPNVTSVEWSSCTYDHGSDLVTAQYHVTFAEAGGYTLPRPDNAYRFDGRREGQVREGLSHARGSWWTATFHTASAYWNDLLPLRTQIVLIAPDGAKVIVGSPQIRLEFSQCSGWPS